MIKIKFQTETLSKILLILVVLLTDVFVAYAYDTDVFIVNDIQYNVLSETERTASVNGYINNPQYVDIPESVNKNGKVYSVVCIASNAFEKCNSIVSVKIPDTVTSIWHWSFSGCSSLKSVSIPNSVKMIGSGVFEGCSSLPYIFIPSSVTEIYDCFSGCSSLESINVADDNMYYCSLDGILYTKDKTNILRCPQAKVGLVEISNNVLTINDNCFYGCALLKSVYIPDSVIEIGDAAFADCSSLDTIELPNLLCRLGADAFFRCISLSQIQIPSTVSEIKKYTFAACFSLSTVDLPCSVTKIGDHAFCQCYSLSSIKLSNDITYIGEGAFANTSLTSIIIPNLVTKISDSLFLGCSSLISVTIPNSITEIGESAFLFCSMLNSICIPKTVTNIGYGAFHECISLKNIYTLPENPPSIGYNYYDPSDSSCFEDISENVNLYIPSGKKNIYSSTEGWSGFTNFIEMGSLEINFDKNEFELEQGDIYELHFHISKGNGVTIDSIDWTTSDSDIAIVENGTISAVGIGVATITLTLIDNYGCPHYQYCDVIVRESAGIERLYDDGYLEEYYKLNGIRVNGNNLAPGIYIKREGDKVSKIIVPF